MSRKAYLYIRVSTDEQADKGYSLRYQEERLTKYCELQNIKAVALFRDDHSAKTFERPEFQKLLASLKKNKGMVNLLLFIKWDRFSRNAGDAYAMINQLNKLGVEPQAIEQPLDLNIPENKIMLAFYLASPEVENDRRALNTFAGMRRAKKEGRCVSTAPKGYKNVKNEFNKKVIVPSEDAEHVKFAFNELAKGIHTVMDVWKMALARGFKYTRSNFFTLIRNPVYCGYIQVPAFKDEPEVLVKGQHEPLITEEVFYRVKDFLDGRKRNVPSKNTRREELPLRGFLLCPRCGKKLTGSASKGRGGKYFYYHCYPGCPERVKAEDANAEFMKLIEQINFYPESVDLLIDGIEQIFRENIFLNSFRSKQLREEMDKLRQRLNKAQELMLDGSIKPDEYRELKNRTEPEIDRLTREYMQLSAQEPNYGEYLKEGKTILQNITYYYAKGDVTVKQAIIGSILREKLVFSQNAYRTPKVIQAVQHICPTLKELQGYKNGNGSQLATHSSMVAGEGLEPPTFRLCLPLQFSLPPF